MIRLFFLLLLILFCVGVGNGLYFLKDGFSSRRIHSLAYPAAEDWDEEARKALQQTFYYIGRGRQCFAFASQDGKYVLKLPRTDIYKTPFWVKALPLHAYREKLEKNHNEKEEFLLNSFRISFNELKDQTGLLAIHLGQSTSKGLFLTVKDAFGCKHRLPLATTSFILQYKHPILMKEFAKAMEIGDQKRAEKILEAILITITERARKGILNRDRSFLRNYGFDGKNAYQIDVGSFFKKPDLSPEEAYQKSLRDSIDPIQEWLSQNFPEIQIYFNTKLKEFLL